jgi:hypothetical protein
MNYSASLPSTCTSFHLTPFRLLLDILCCSLPSILMEIVRAIALDTIERGETPKGIVRNEEELNTRLGI